MSRLATAMAVLGGLVLSLLIVLVCASVIGRALNDLLHGPVSALAPAFAQWAIDAGIGPINGDFELVEAGVAFAIFAFLPLCQITGGHASVDIFTQALPLRIRRILMAVIEVVFAAVLILITVKLYDGMVSKMRYGETSFLIQFPVWWAYAASLFGAVMASVTIVYTACARIVEAVTGQDILGTTT